MKKKVKRERVRTNLTASIVDRDGLEKALDLSAQPGLHPDDDRAATLVARVCNESVYKLS